MDGVIGEVTRTKGCHPHIQHPAQPKLLFGCCPFEIAVAAKILSLRAKDSRGRRLRRDGKVLVSGVVTYPTPRVDLEKSAVERDIYENWKTETLAWLMERSGIIIQCVVEHLDEEYMNIHYFALPTLTDDLRLNFDAVHPGRKARDAAAKRPRIQRAAVQAAYQCAMIDWQDHFFQEVSVRFGHERFGPRRRRVARDRHKILRQGQREEAQMRAAIELEYCLAETSEETETLTRKVRDDDFAAAAVQMIQTLSKELAEKKERLREMEFIGSNDFPPPPSPNQSEPIAPAIPNPLAAFDEFDNFPEPQLEFGPDGSSEWTEYIAGLTFGADQVKSAIEKRRVEPTEDNNALFLPKDRSS